MITNEEREYLLKSMANLLGEYDYKFTEEALGKIVDRWAEQKASLIEGFKKHPFYVKGQFMIAFQTKHQRNLDLSGVKAFSRWLKNKAMPRTELLPDAIKNRLGWSSFLPYDLYDFLASLSYYADRCITENAANAIKQAIPEVRVRTGEKMSRAIGRIMKYLNYDKVEGYEKEFAKFSDSLSPRTIKRHTVMSVNPLDYLTMSFGNSWASCHTIDKNNKRDMPNSYEGMYSSGTMSYMLDGTSMVFYTVDKDYKENEYWTQPKINRQMFHYGEDKLIQGRLYPQDDDKCASEYEENRNVARSIISTVFNFPNLWTLRTGSYNASSHVTSLGTHYRDYECYSNCSESTIEGSENQNNIVIGSKPICVRCGKEHDLENTIDCCVYARCEKCGRYHNESDVVVIDGHTYCKNCVYYCSRCHKYHIGNSTYIRRTGVCVCDECLDKYYFLCKNCGRYETKSDLIEIDGNHYCNRCATPCNICGKYHLNNRMTYIYQEGINVCNECRTEHYVMCHWCGDFIRKEEAITIDGTTFCDHCAVFCDICKEYHILGSTRIYSEGIRVCRKCRDKHFVMCDRCDEWIRKEEAISDGDSYYCRDCNDAILAERRDEEEALSRYRKYLKGIRENKCASYEKENNDWDPYWDWKF